MDGNWGGTAGISEMLLQSQDGFINMLPALPDEWQSGSLHGFKVRGGATADIQGIYTFGPFIGRESRNFVRLSFFRYLCVFKFTDL